ncbi:transposase [Paenibacillus sp. FSL P4-0502]|uniref:transposase n=1 Tax=Paenibacillus sp. FSL P4-0502 TaxID=2975319 RepID=UPI0030FC449A
MPSTKNRITPEKRLYFHSELRKCPHCGTKLKRHHTAWHKYVNTLNGIFDIWNMAYACPHPDCPYPESYYRSAEADAFVMKHTSYGFDVLALVGELRFKHHYTLSELHEELNRRGVVTSERNCERLYERYLTLLRASVTDHLRKTLVEVVREHGGLLLSMDGVQPEKGNETLYVVREAFSGSILAAQNLKSGSAEELKRLLKPVEELGFPIVGLLSDGQHSIRLAMSDLWPEVPYQYCQYHYLKDIAKPVMDLDRKLKTGIKKNLRGIRSLEKKIQSDDSEDAAIAKDYLAAVRAILLEDGNPPLDLPGVRVYEEALAIQRSLQRSAKKGGSSTLKNS